MDLTFKKTTTESRVNGIYKGALQGENSMALLFPSPRDSGWKLLVHKR